MIQQITVVIDGILISPSLRSWFGYQLFSRNSYQLSLTKYNLWQAAGTKSFCPLEAFHSIRTCCLKFCNSILDTKKQLHLLKRVEGRVQDALLVGILFDILTLSLPLEQGHCLKDLLLTPFPIAEQCDIQSCNKTFLPIDIFPR